MQFGGRYGFGSVSVRIRCMCETALRQLNILILNPLSLLVYNKNMSAYYMYIVVGMLQLGMHT